MLDKMRTRRQVHGDEGVALIMVLILVFIFSIVAGAIISFAGTSFRRTVVVQDRVEKVTAANAGIRYTLERLGIDETLCANPAAQTGTGVPLPQLVLDREVQLKCIWVAGLPLGVGGYAMVLTAEGLDTDGDGDFDEPMLATQSGNLSKNIIGNVYFASTRPEAFSFQVGSTADPDLEIETGFVRYRQDDCDTAWAPPADIVLTPPNSPYGYDCTTSPWQDIVLLPTFPASPPPDAPIVAVNPDRPYRDIDGCRVWYPGRYTADTMTEDDLKLYQNYFASGVYYLDGVGRLEVRNTIIGGAPAVPQDIPVLDDEAGSCSSMDDETALAGLPVGVDPAVGGSGVTLVLGGDSQVFVRSHMEVFRRDTGIEGDPFINVSVITVPPDATGGWTPHSIPISELAFETQSGFDNEIVIHGTAITPYAGIGFGNVSNESFDQFLSGIVAARVELQGSNSVPPGYFLISTETGPFTRELILESTAIGRNSNVTARVLVQVGNDSSRPTGIRSWRIE